MLTVRSALVWLCLLVLVKSCDAEAHEAPSGWTYGTDCCSVSDCHPVHGVLMTPEGWLVAETGETIPWGDPRIRLSQDGEYHACVPDAGRVRCLYVPMEKGL